MLSFQIEGLDGSDKVGRDNTDNGRPGDRMGANNELVELACKLGCPMSVGAASC